MNYDSMAAVFYLIGMILIVVGLYLIWAPLGVIGAGVCLFAWGYGASLMAKEAKKAQDHD